jgi:undecaprenyl diphosphate synthase
MKLKVEDGIPTHVALIPDGNRRWARKKGFLPWIGHESGTKTLDKILEKALDLQIQYFTFWAASFDNLTKRSKTEVKFLLKVFHNQFKRALKDERVVKNKVNVNFLGRWPELIPQKTQKVMKELMKKTKNYNRYFLTFLLAYNGTDEMIDCIKKVSQKGIKHITEKTIKQNLWTKDLPPVDLIIRTGCEGDPHMSAGFMMWDTAYSQLYFTKTLFPAFSTKEFEEIIKDYQKRERRMGR